MENRSSKNHNGNKITNIKSELQGRTCKQEEKKQTRNLES